MKRCDDRSRAVLGPLLLSALSALMGWAGCGGASTGSGSGETHFLAYCDPGSCDSGLSCQCGVCTKPCGSDDECSALVGGAECRPAQCAGEQAVCDVECTGADQCSALGAGFDCVAGRCRSRAIDGSGGSGPDRDAGPEGGLGPDGSIDRACPTGCTIVSASPVVDCVSLPEDFPDQVACDCGTPSGPPSCHRRVADGTAWYFVADQLSEPDAWTDCDAAQEQAATFACDYSECDHPPASTCRPDALCQVLDCGGFDYFEDGCARATCESDADCAADERCTTNECGTTTGPCTYGSSGCECAFGPPVCLVTHVCHPVSSMGPRGEWLSLEVQQGTGPCGVDDCSSTWTFTPDGNVSFSKRGTPGTATVDAGRLLELELLIDGRELRRGLRDGMVCDGPPTDIGVSIRLTLEGETLERDVTGCAVSGPDGNVVQRIYQLALAY